MSIISKALVTNGSSIIVHAFIEANPHAFKSLNPIFYSFFISFIQLLSLSDRGGKNEGRKENEGDKGVREIYHFESLLIIIKLIKNT